MNLRFRDFLERVLLFAFVGWLAYQLSIAIGAGQTPWVSALVLFGELVVLVLVFVRRPAADMSLSWRDWLLAFSASAAPLMVIPHGHQLAPAWFVGLLFVLGIVLQVAAKLSLARSFGMVPANRGVVTTGMYSIVRHPVYASYLIGHVAFLLANWSAWNISLYAIALALQIARMLSEEALLTRDPTYAAYRQTVRYRLLPGVF